MLGIDGSGPHTILLSTLCGQCPQGATGCCTGPPEYDWSDIGRVVFLGGRDFLLEGITHGHLTPSARGLVLRRVRGRASPDARRRLACVHHGPKGCTISPDRRPATCNYYLCQDAYDEPSAGASVQTCRTTHAQLAGWYRAWDDTIASLIRELWPGGPVWDTVFLDWLGDRFRELSAETQPKAGRVGGSGP